MLKCVVLVSRILGDITSLVPLLFFYKEDYTLRTTGITAIMIAGSCFLKLDYTSWILLEVAGNYLKRFIRYTLWRIKNKKMSQGSQ